MSKSNVYTKTGDKGKTSLVGGKRVSKNNERLEAYGTVDELNSHVGLLMADLVGGEDWTFLKNIQNILFVVGSNLATDTEERELYSSSIITSKMVREIEEEIDKIDEKLPKLKVFVLPSGSRGASLAHVCRSVCRRAERCIVTLADVAEVDDNLMTYINRLSDYFFVLSRKINLQEGKKEIFWNE